MKPFPFMARVAVMTSKWSALIVACVPEAKARLRQAGCRASRANAKTFPVIDLFYRVPVEEFERLRVDTDFRAAVARVLHWTLLAPYIDQADMEQLVAEIHRSEQEDAQKTSGPVVPWITNAVGLKENIRGALGR